MRSKVWTFVNWGVLIVFVLIAIWVIVGVPQSNYKENVTHFSPSDSCVDVGGIEGFKYDACYDTSSQMIFLKASREQADYEIKGIVVSFVDEKSQTFDSKDIPVAGGSKSYKIPSVSNPGRIGIDLRVVRNFSGSLCLGENIAVEACPASVTNNGVGASLSSTDENGVESVIGMKDISNFDSDIISTDLVDKEKIWKSTCKSTWDCGEWESCSGGVQRRDCEDLNSCYVATDSPVTVRGCNGTCIENWKCEWSACTDGFIVPHCEDLSRCGTSFNAPEKLSCGRESKCVPDIVCENWSACEVDYNFMDLVGYENVVNIGGAKSRVCVDETGCIPAFKEESNCSVSVDIYTEKIEKCGKEYVGVYDALDGSTLAVLDESNRSGDYLNVYFGDEGNVHCDYCFDGKQDGDEEDVDCGGSCESCSVRVYKDRHWWDFIFG